MLRTRDRVNGDWEPDWVNGGVKFSLDVEENDIDEYCSHARSNLLSFENREKRQQFRELITDEEIIEFLNF